ncbi:glycoside hydrolase family 15 protein [Methanocella arvoryzae]|uniref:Predicted glycoside hydrolase/transferase n=1 Tax=Methanocella arvoryzae (strain DSM 22066 / NBRC 105507 / MRE50) TaxID=351160 RepID=Q0W3I8_METAR|nr:glycoside hydrolase family 15 protein [Methanocella arvoryzae]CAJ37055.1 predicted glycoside hydrolase/transferase [Methanocella arvoryzae MRE50]
MYGIIGNGETCAFISIFSSLDWLCVPRFDSPTFFARALDSTNGGSVTLSWEMGGSTLPFEGGEQRYVEDTCVLETTTYVGDDTIRATDFMPWGKRRLWRILGISGPDRLKLHINIDPRPDYNRAIPEMATGENDITLSVPGQAIRISTTEKPSIRKSRLTFDVEPPLTIPLLLTYGETPEECHKEAKRADFLKDHQADLRFWRCYASKAHPVFELSPRLHYYYMRSLLVLKQLIYDPTGAILAAPTTSFPEVVGKDSNWDYRFCWVRDGAYSAEALVLAGMKAESRKLLDFLLRIASKEGKPYPYPLVSIDGDLNGTEEVLLDSLVGFGNSRPVRIGNKAVDQKQNDLEGEVIHALSLYDRYSGDTEYVPEHFGEIERIVDYVASHWTEKDAGIWEFRREDMDYVHSKTMCWAALEHGARLALRVDREDLARRWRHESNAIREDVIANGWSEKRKCFKRAYQDEAYDASILAIPLMNMLPVTDPLVRTSVKSITDHLGTGGLLKRFEEEPGAFMLSSLWLAQVMMKKGKVVNSLDIINRAARYASSDLGLFAEEYDMYYQRLVGNIPQSFSHEEFVKSIHYLLGKE